MNGEGVGRRVRRIGEGEVKGERDGREGKGEGRKGGEN